MPSFAFRTAWVRPRTCVVRRSEIAMPAASSHALLMRRPDDKRCKELDRSVCDLFRLRCTLRVPTFVFMASGIRVWIRFPWQLAFNERNSHLPAYGRSAAPFSAPIRKRWKMLSPDISPPLLGPSGWRHQCEAQSSLGMMIAAARRTAASVRPAPLTAIASCGGFAIVEPEIAGVSASIPFVAQ